MVPLVEFLTLVRTVEKESEQKRRPRFSVQIMKNPLIFVNN